MLNVKCPVIGVFTVGQYGSLLLLLLLTFLTQTSHVYIPKTFHWKKKRLPSVCIVQAILKFKINSSCLLFPDFWIASSGWMDGDFTKWKYKISVLKQHVHVPQTERAALTWLLSSNVILVRWSISVHKRPQNKLTVVFPHTLSEIHLLTGTYWSNFLLGANNLVFSNEQAQINICQT